MNHLKINFSVLFMKRFYLVFYVFFLIAASPVQASLINNGDGTITDTDRRLMWLTNSNLTNSPMNWIDSKNWAENLVFSNYDDWRLPSALNRDGTGICFGFNCSGSEMGHLFYKELLNEAGITPINTGPFENIDIMPTSPAYSRYWLSSELGCCGAMMFGFFDGDQGGNNKNELAYAWAVRPIPLPAAAWLFGSALLGFFGFSRRKANA